MAGRCILVLGGARSGKSDFAQGLASELGERVLFAATAQALDDDMRRRIEEHRRGRPAGWRTLEEPVEVSRAIEDHRGDAQVVLGRRAATDGIVVISVAASTFGDDA